jgi:hypothetical protein
MGFNMSWIFSDGIDQGALYEALDLAPTCGTPSWRDLGTSRVPWAGVRLKSGWCAVFAKYALVMDVATATNPPRVTRLPAGSRSVICVVLEHAMMSYASLWQGGCVVWWLHHDPSQGLTHLDGSGDLPPEFAGFRNRAMERQRALEERGERGADHLFDVPLDTAATITEYRHDRGIAGDIFGNLRTLVPVNGNVPTKLSQPPTWWQTAGSMKYD